MATDTGDTGQTDQVKLTRVDLGESSIELPAEDAKALIALRDKNKDLVKSTYRSALAKKTSELEAEVTKYKTAEQEARVKLEQQTKKALEDQIPAERLAEIKAVLQKEVEKTKSEAASEVQKWKSSSIKDKLHTVVSSQKDIVPTAITDVVKQIMGDSQFDISSKGELIAVADGQPVRAENGDIITAEALVTKFLAERDWLKLHKGATGTKEKKVTESADTVLAGMSSETRIELMQKGLLHTDKITNRKTT
jgi:hypothetical protein